jgi:hypothetical protein
MPGILNSVILVFVILISCVFASNTQALCFITGGRVNLDAFVWIFPDGTGCSVRSLPVPRLGGRVMGTADVL